MHKREIADTHISALKRNVICALGVPLICPGNTRRRFVASQTGSHGEQAGAMSRQGRQEQQADRCEEWAQVIFHVGDTAYELMKPYGVVPNKRNTLALTLVVSGSGDYLNTNTSVVVPRNTTSRRSRATIRTLDIREVPHVRRASTKSTQSEAQRHGSRGQRHHRRTTTTAAEGTTSSGRPRIGLSRVRGAVDRRWAGGQDGQDGHWLVRAAEVGSEGEWPGLGLQGEWATLGRGH
ncbi:hypothetical protein GGX14DRAFT_394048 [Mycena pura]|uniref:Uncharacterized protein n=1 Tax=Mycena pura TaxID=153505 RepID=A0AAD6VHP1_9AGAR|nr:hypothetical protein GGX14DRAFT_394048 [Mycena pura]